MISNATPDVQGLGKGAAEVMTATRSGVAVIYVKDRAGRRAYEGTTVYDAGGVHLGTDGRLRVRHDGEDSGISYRAVGARSWPHSAVIEVRWLELGTDQATVS